MSRQILGPAQDFAARPTVLGTGVALLSEVGGAVSHVPVSDITVASNASVVVNRTMLLGSGRKLIVQNGGRLRIL